MFKKAIWSFLITLALMMVSFNANAVPPEIVWEYEGPDDISVVECDGYDVRTSSWAKITVTWFFDKDGNPIREHTLVKIHDAIYYNSEDPGIYIRNQGAGNGENISFWYDMVNDTFKESGMPYRIMLPGVGKLYMLAGHGVDDGEGFFWTGLNVFPVGGSGSKLCEALAAP